MTSAKWRLGSGWMVVAAVFFGLMGVFVKLGAEYFSSTELVFWRTLMGVVTLGRRRCGGAIASPPLAALPRAARPDRLCLDAIVFLRHRPSALVHRGDAQLHLADVPGAAVGGAAARAPAQTGAGRPGAGLCRRGAVAASHAVQRGLAGLLGVGSGLLAGWSYLHVRELGRQGEPEWKVVFYFALISTLGGLLLMLFETWHPVTLQNAWLLLGLGATATIAQLAMTRAYKVGRKLLAANLSYLTVVFSTLLGVGLWGDPLSAASLAAMGLIIVSGMLASRR